MLNLNNIEVVRGLDKINGRITQAVHYDSTAKSLYMSAFISSCIHALEHGDHTPVQSSFDKIPSTSIYKAKIKRWISERSPLRYNTSKKVFTRKVNDGKKVQWSESIIQDLIDHPFYEKSESEEKSFDMLKELSSLDKRIKKLIESANDSGASSEKLEAIHKILNGSEFIVTSE